MIPNGYIIYTTTWRDKMNYVRRLYPDKGYDSFVREQLEKSDNLIVLNEGITWIDVIDKKDMLKLNV